MKIQSLTVAFFIFLPLVDGKTLQRHIEIKNESGSRVELYWINGDEMAMQNPNLVNGQSVALNSYVNHTFMVREIPSAQGTCNEGSKYATPSISPVCRTAFITVNDHDDQVIHILQDMDIEVEDSNSIAQEVTSSIISTCEDRVRHQIEAGSMEAREVIDAFSSCAQPLVARQIEKSNQEIKEQSDLRMNIGGQWEEYTCADFDLPTTSPKSMHSWNYQGKQHDVGVLLDRDEAKIHFIKNFITPEECAAIEAAAAPTLHKATVADGSGGSHLQKSRKAMQAGVHVPWEREADGDPIASVSRKLYAYINEATGYNIQIDGQEDLMSIQYFGRGLNDPEPDRYMPHCDGQCDGQKFQEAGRVATMVMYCKAPLKGGATNFRNVGVHVVPEVGAAAFFSYLGSDGRTDNHLTEHSCCPVLEGEKKIAVQWLRLGVDKENPWDSFNTLNVKHGLAESM